MTFLRRHWYNVGAGMALIAIIVLALAWGDMTRVQALLLANFIALLLHQFEEYGWPGGEPAIMNMALQESDRPDRYPLNQNSAMVVNILAAYIFYLLPVFLPGILWLGIAPALFGLGQFGIHGVVTPKKLGQFYNPGVAVVILLHIPIGLAYFWTIRHDATVTDWVIGVAYTGAFMFVALVKMTYSWLADRESTYPFPPDEMTRFDVPGKLARLKAAADARHPGRPGGWGRSHGPGPRALAHEAGSVCARRRSDRRTGQHLSRHGGAGANARTVSPGEPRGTGCGRRSEESGDEPLGTRPPQGAPLVR